MSLSKDNELPASADENMEENGPRTLHGLKVVSAPSHRQHPRRV